MLEQMLAAIEMPTIGTPMNKVLDSITKDGAPFAASDFEMTNPGGQTYTVKQFNHAPPNVRDFLLPLMRGYGDVVCMVFEDERITFTDAIQKVDTLAAALYHDYNIRKGDLVSISMRNYPEWLVSYLAVISLGGIACAMNSWWGGDEMAMALKITDSKLLICGPRSAANIENHVDELGLKRILVRVDDHQFTNAAHWNDVLGKAANKTLPDIDIAPTDTVHILFTSGSSGFPKAAVSDHRSVCNALFMWLGLTVSMKLSRDGNMEPGEHQKAALLAIPKFHVTGLIVITLTSAIIGRKLVLMRKWNVENAFQLIEREKISSFSGVPSMSYEMSVSPFVDQYDTSTLADLGGGGAARPKDHLEKMTAAFSHVSPGIGYGLTETNGCGAVLFGDDYIKRQDSVGWGTPPVMDIQIQDLDGNEVAQGERGEICIKSITNIAGYLNNAEATERAFRSGWLRTGDVGYKDSKGYIFIVDRMKSIIIRGGENISTLEVEAAIHALEGVEDCIVFGVPDERLGEQVGAFIETSSLSSAEVRTSLKDSVAAYKIPFYMWITDQPTPRIASGKADRTGVKASCLDDLSSAQ